MSTSRLGAGGDLWISPNYMASQWRDLNISATPKPNWEEAAKIFHDRIVGRFLAPVDAMRKHADAGIREFCGFTVLAIDCLLIETLGQFYRGYQETPSPKDKTHNPEGKKHSDFYVEFMNEISHLSKADCFDTPKKRSLFYKHFRCGILHQAQTKSKSRVRFGETKMARFANQADHDQGLIVDRELLHNALVDEVLAYEGLLKSGADATKRTNFIKKMDLIAL